MLTDHIEAAFAASQKLVLPDVLTVKRLMSTLGKSGSAVRSLLRSGRIPATKIGKTWLVEREAFLRSLTPEYERQWRLAQRPRGRVMPLPRRREGM